jgi:cysteinyl-tRNA synthetase
MFFFFGELNSTRRLPLSFHNTLTGNVEAFRPHDDDIVRMYNCGPTVYDFQHIGNLRPYIFADILRRTLEQNGYEVDQVVNITDVGHLVSDADYGEDKMEKSARASGETVQDIVKKVSKAFFADLEAVNINTKEIRYPRATEYIQEQIALVQSLEEKGYTYTTSDGVYFDTSRFTRYGKLGNINLSELREGARVDENPERRHPSDFALWKLTKPNEKRLQEWPSPWGMGFPGWHIECSAMSMKLLGKQIDIHTGGEDHIPVHHNNEIAQSECATGKTPFSKYWLHNAFITIENRKISKSLGNTILLRNITDRGLSPLAYRYWLLTGHYRTPMNFTWQAVEGAHTALMRLQKYFVDELRNEPNGEPSQKYVDEFMSAINQDLDTPRAIAITWELVKDTVITKGEKRATLLAFDTVLGLNLTHIASTLDSVFPIKVIELKDLPKDIYSLVEQREIARRQKQWLEADRIRDDLLVRGYRIEDATLGPRIEKI